MTTAVPNWNKLPVEPVMAWYDDSNVRVGGTIGFWAVGLGVAVLASRLSSVAAKAFQCVVLTACFYVTRRALLEPSLNDPKIWKEKRVKAGKEIDEGGTFKEFKTKYHDLIAKRILVETDIHYVIERDVQVLGYAEFMKKHADERCKQELVNALQPSSRELLGAKCLVMIANGGFPDAIDQSIRSKPQFNVNELALLAKSWDEFIRNRGDVREVTDPAALEALKHHFLAKAYRRGGVDIRDAFGFPEEISNEINKTMIQFELELIADGKILPADCKWCCFNWESFAEEILQFKPEKLENLKQALREHYVQTVSSNELQGEEFKARREACGLTLEFIQKAQVSVQAECEKLPYFGEEGFRKKYGIKHLTNGALTEANLDKIRAEIREIDPRSQVISIEYFEDLQMLGLDREILDAHFMKKTLQEIWTTEKELFLKYCRSSDEVVALFKPKIIAEVKDLPIFELLVEYRDLFSTILQATDMNAHSKTFAEQAEESVQAAGKLNAQVYEKAEQRFGGKQFFHLVNYLNNLLLLKLITPTSPALRSVIRASFEEYGTKLFTEKVYLSYGTQDMWGKFFDTWITVDVKACHFFATARKQVQEEHKKLEREKLAIHLEPSENADYKALNDQWQKSLREIKARKPNLEKLQQGFAKLKELLERNDQQITTQRGVVATLQSTLRGFAEVEQGVQKQMESVRAWTAPDADFVEETRQLQKLRDGAFVTELESREKEYEKLTEQFAILADRSQIIANLQGRLDAIPVERTICQKELGREEEKIRELLREKEELPKVLQAKAQDIEEFNQETARLQAISNSLSDQMNAIATANSEDKKARKAQLDAVFQAFAKERLDQLDKLLFQG